jgi:hypothetical protein
MKLNEIVSLVENMYQNKWGYDKFQYAMIKMWGGVLYLDYEYLPRGQGNIKNLEAEVNEYLDAHKRNDLESVQDLEEWFQDGAKRNGKVFFTQDMLDDVLHSAETAITAPITVYKSGEKTHKNDRWISTTLDSDQYKHMGKEQKYDLPVGTKVVFADGIADKNEVIIHTSELPNK